jgi:VRR-NUC domain
VGKRKSSAEVFGWDNEAQLKAAILARWKWNPTIKPMCNAQDNRHLKTGLGEGSADIVVVMAPLGRFAAFEVKLPGKNAEPHQAAWLDEIRKMGGFGCVVHSIAEADEGLKRAQAGQLG